VSGRYLSVSWSHVSGTNEGLTNGLPIVSDGRRTAYDALTLLITYFALILFARK